MGTKLTDVIGDRQRIEDKLDQLQQQFDVRLQQLDANCQQFQAQFQLNQAHEAKFQQLSGDIEALKKASIGYRKIRHRFIDNFKRNVLGYIGPDGHKRIAEGNMAAHQGDAAVDTLLYSLGERDDGDASEILYGLSVPEIELLSKN
jgi:hypothetical protein